MPVKKLQRQAIELGGQAIAQIEVKALGKARHAQTLRRIENKRRGPDSQVDKDLLAARLPSDRKLPAGGIGRLDLRPDVVDKVRRIGGRGNRAHCIKDNGDDHDNEAPALVCSFVPQATHRSPSVARLEILKVALVRIMHVGQALLLAPQLLALFFGKKFLGREVLILLIHVPRLPSSATRR